MKKVNKWQIFIKVILPSNKQNILNTFKINISMIKFFELKKYLQEKKNC